MKSALFCLLLIVGVLPLAAQDPVGVKLKEVKVLGEAPNKSGERVLVREFRVDAMTDKTGAFLRRYYYRFEFYSLGILYHSATTWDMSEPGKFKIAWSSDDKCDISLINDWLQVTFERDKWSQPWSFSRRID